MKILSQKMIRDNRCLVVSTGKTVWKVPLFFTGWREAELEKNMIVAAEKDQHFVSYLPSYTYVSHISKTPIMTTVAAHPQKQHLMKEYFEKAFARSAEWQHVSLRALADLAYFIGFLSQHTSENMEFWDELLGMLTVPGSSAHGDFNLDHVFLDGDRLRFIDWTLYSRDSSRYFDLINYWIFSQKIGNESWMEIWKKHSANPPAEIFGVPISQDEYKAYAIWKVAIEVKLLSLRSRLDKLKQRKYQNFINHLGKVLK